MSHIQSRELSRIVKDEAHKLGFELAGICSADPSPHIDIYENWLREGRNGEMGYLATERARLGRADPRQILPECKSILVVGANYLSLGAKDNQTSATHIAAYALGDDYHDVFVARLTKLIEFLQGLISERFAYRIYTDTGPILERELAQRAGLGWIGKNTCLISPKGGSYFLLGEVLLTLPLEPDEPFTTDHCGNCTRCIDACPTASILPDRTLDARRCISYLTIELKGPIPAEQRPDIGNRLFGCDICQQVCPWNQRFAQTSEEVAFKLRPFLETANLMEILQLDDDGFRAAFQGSPIKRAKRRGLLRNAAIVAGNICQPSLLPILGSLLLNDPEPLIREHAAWALGQFDCPESAAFLKQAKSHERDRGVRHEIENAIMKSSTIANNKSTDYDPSSK